MAKRILLIEDEKKLALILKETLGLYDYEVFLAADGVEGLKSFYEIKPDLLIVDIMMPGMDGFELLSRLRRTDKDIPVIVLTAKSQTVDLVKGFELGCHDYIKKPFIIDELLVRVKASLNRVSISPQAQNTPLIIPIGSFVFNVDGQELRSPSNVFQLSFKETEILKRLCMHPNRVLERKNVLLELWGDDNLFNSRNLNVYITRLRNYFKDDKTIQILNLRSIGYKLIVKIQYDAQRLKT